MFIEMFDEPSIGPARIQGIAVLFYMDGTLT